MRSTTYKTTHLGRSGRSAVRLTAIGALALAAGLGGSSAALAAPVGGPTDICSPHPKRSFSISDDFVYEHQNASLSVKLSGPACYTVKVDFATANGSAKAGSDYVAKSGTLTFAPGTTQKNIVVDVIDDAVSEPNETFTVVLSNPVAANISDSLGKVTISGLEPAG